MNDKHPAPVEAPADENQIIAERRAKLADLRAKGLAYPNDFRRDSLAASCTPSADVRLSRWR